MSTLLSNVTMHSMNRDVWVNSRNRTRKDTKSDSGRPCGGRGMVFRSPPCLRGFAPLRRWRPTPPPPRTGRTDLPDRKPCERRPIDRLPRANIGANEAGCRDYAPRPPPSSTRRVEFPRDPPSGITEPRAPVRAHLRDRAWQLSMSGVTLHREDHQPVALDPVDRTVLVACAAP